jgi:hypothetical protein
MVGAKIVRNEDDGHAYGSLLPSKVHFFSPESADTHGYELSTSTHSGTFCINANCAASKYPLPELYKATSDATGFSLTRVEFFSLEFGDVPPSNRYIDMNVDFLPAAAPGRLVLEPGTWGQDMDVRRIIPKNAAMCGGAISNGNCILNGKAFPDTSFTPTKYEKRWIFVLVEHVYFKMIRITATLDAATGGVYMRVLDAGYNSHIRDPNDIDTSDSMAYDVTARYLARRYMPVAECFRQHCDAGEMGAKKFQGYGVGSIKFDIATEMSVSLVGHDC